LQSGTGETQMVTLPLSMANAITASQTETSSNLLQAAAQASDLQVSYSVMHVCMLCWFVGIFRKI